MPTLEDVLNAQKAARILKGEYTIYEWFVDIASMIIAVLIKSFLWSIVPLGIAYYIWG